MLEHVGAVLDELDAPVEGADVRHLKGEPPAELHDDDVDEIVEASEVVAVACVQREAFGEGRGGDEEVDHAGARALRPAATTAANTLPYPRALSLSNGSGSKAASARCSRSCRRLRSSVSAAACGPAASSAIDTALTATSTGSSPASRVSRSINTDVSRRPRASRWVSATRSDVLACCCVQVGAELAVVELRGGFEQRHGGLSCDEPMAPERC